VFVVPWEGSGSVVRFSSEDFTNTFNRENHWLDSMGTSTSLFITVLDSSERESFFLCHPFIQQALFHIIFYLEINLLLFHRSWRSQSVGRSLCQRKATSRCSPVEDRGLGPPGSQTLWHLKTTEGLPWMCLQDSWTVSRFSHDLTCLVALSFSTLKRSTMKTIVIQNMKSELYKECLPHRWSTTRSQGNFTWF